MTTTIHQTAMLDALERRESRPALKLYDKIAAGHTQLVPAEGRLLRIVLTKYRDYLTADAAKATRRRGDWLDAYEFDHDVIDAIEELLRHLPE